ncbi:outer membrane protein assembly factor BamD [Bryobacter aggregatus]|uniref:outer membrane protein assembly factor BamD n=1 Tax=Bryobacter aggregatus TaxID=360054 RepID=UPI00068C146C|nr:outer membrane protein assembly factor BamD [Bryobacter aggregatus]
MSSFYVVRLSCLVLLTALLTFSTGCRKRKYENPITKDTQQPDKVLYDKAVADIERGRFEVARLTLQTLINTYDTSEFLAKAKLAIADSWFREGGTNGLAQAEAEYKDFILFYPTMEEAAESQEKVCTIHYRQMEKADRDNNHALRAEEECRQLLIQFPNSKFAPRATQLVRNIQEALAEGEMRVSDFYYKKQSWASSSNRYQALADQYPLYSRADEANFKLGDAYQKMGARFKDRAGKAFAKVVREFPLSAYADDAKKRLQEMELVVPDADPTAVARMKYELENRTKPGLTAPVMNMLKRGPDVHLAAKSGTPSMTPIRPTIPVNVPIPAAVTAGTTDVTVSTVNDSSTLDQSPDARRNAPGAAAPDAAAPGAASAETPASQAAPAAETPAATDANAPIISKGTLIKPKKQKKAKAPKTPKAQQETKKSN